MTLPGPFPPSLEEFVRLFNAHHFWESHEVLERPWRVGRSDFYQGLILYASALVHAQRGNRHGIRAQFAKARRRLERYLPGYLGIDLRALLSRARELEAAGAVPGPHTYPTIRLDPALLRGDEPELRPTATPE